MSLEEDVSLVSRLEGMDLEDLEFSDDIRVQELQSCSAIYPDCKIDYKSLSGSIDVPIKAQVEVRLVNQEDEKSSAALASSSVVNLPPVNLSFKLPEKYPYDEPPQISVSSTVLAQPKLADLDTTLNQIWLDYKDQVLYHLIEFMHDNFHSNIDDFVPPVLELTDPKDYYGIVQHNSAALQHEFEMQTFTCEICQQDYKGTHCLRFPCQHTFCSACLSQYFTSVISSGEVDKVHCPNYNCTKQYVEKKKEYSNLGNWVSKNADVEEIVHTLLVPEVSLNFLSQILRSGKTPLTEIEALVKRYHTLFKKSQYEFISTILPHRLVNCPRVGCEEVILRKDMGEKLLICPKCSYAFCNDCRRSWHGRFAICKKPPDDETLYQGIAATVVSEYINMPNDSTEKAVLRAKYGKAVLARAVDEYDMDQLFNNMLTSGTNIKECPTCHIVIEKTDGCNRMKCSHCAQHFCFLCGLSLTSGYEHYSDVNSPCYKRLLEGIIADDE